jgi:hypothetical protein
MVLHQGPEILWLWSVWACSLWCQQRADKANYMGCFAFWSWSQKHQAFASSYTSTQECSGGRTDRNAAYGVFSLETHSTATISSIQVVDLLWFERSLSSVCSGSRGKGSWQEGEIIDYSYCQDGDSCLCISFLRLHTPFAIGTRLVIWFFFTFLLSLCTVCCWHSVCRILCRAINLLASRPPFFEGENSGRSPLQFL